MKNTQSIILLITISFFITFLLIRFVTYLQKIKILPNQHSRLHIHHYIIGILLILITGFISIIFDITDSKNSYAVILGIGAALIIDESAMLIYLKDVYWKKKGRLSIYLIVVFIMIFLTITLLTN